MNTFPPLRRRLLAVAALVVAAIGIGTAAVAATDGPITGIGGKCLDVTDGRSANGVRIQLWTCTGGAAQRWTAGDDGTVGALGRCLDVAAASTADGAAVQLYDCNGSAAQRWTASAGRLVNAGSGKCLDAAGRSSANGTVLQIWTCGTGANQLWTLPAGPSNPPTGGQCPAGTPTGSPLPATTVAATKIRDGFNFLEGPAWDAATLTLKLTDMHDGSGPENVQSSDILTYTPATGAFSTFLTGAGSNGLAISRDGTQLVAATHDQRSVSTFDLRTGARGVLAANYQGRRFNSPNDLTIGPDDTVYFTDPDFQRANRADEMAGKTSVFRVKNGVVTLIDDTIREPNGIELSPDAKWLYVGGNATGKVYRYPVAADGSTGVRADFVSLAGTDGGTIDCAGNVYQVTFSDGKVHVYAPGGQSLGTITAGRNATNAAFGGPDGRTLFITSGSPSSGGDTGNYGLYSVRLNIPGSPY
ncbi:SMP-30/gluconolactonase/LRE family protein [Actinoplanes awajinensis]|uniref:Ricin B lectin domain-containing protein n=1 Tax=Actinoplanes awajinensis subsp. mycoplanecinus TaxID=135947 RepID=A0A101JHR0_9ACTN|nr:SMP-30/gluconolactonase/LRE family protein [Actinoplanes awajinensis]KUL27014.1 hypothetical protein ADL15_36480 [Actinoplanes awajinensis subsp. mycoplanecinus]